MTSTSWLGLNPVDAEKEKFKSFEFSDAKFELAYPRSRTLTPNIALIGSLLFVGFVDIAITHAVG